VDEVPRSETPMIAGRRYCGMLRNQFESVPYALAKSEVATRITRTMRDGHGDIVAEDLTRLDSGALAEDKLLPSSRRELRQALKRRIGLATERDAVERLMDRLDGGVPREGQRPSRADQASPPDAVRQLINELD